MEDQQSSDLEFSSVVQCPHCQTAFHVGLAQLQIAAGKVRCGSCLRVFSAKNNFLIEQRQLFDEQEQEATTTPPDDIAQPAPNPTLRDLESPEESPLNSSLDSTPNSNHPPSQVQSSENHGIQENQAIDVDTASEFTTVDNSAKPSTDTETANGEPGHHNDGNDKQVASETKSTVESNVESDIELELSEVTELLKNTDVKNTDVKNTDVKNTDIKNTNVNSTDDNSEDGPILLGNFNHHQGKSIPRETLLQHQVQDFNATNYKQASVEEALSPKQLQSSSIQTSHSPFANSLPPKSSDNLEKRTLSPEPSKDQNGSDAGHENTIERLFIHAKSSSHQLVLKSLNLVFLSFVLVLQIFVWRPEISNSVPTFQQWGNQLCSWIDCAHPFYADIEKIAISGFVVSHAQFSNVLTTKIDLNNQGLAPQPFPYIAVIFRSIKGNTTASREFSPAQYLRGGATGMKLMPVGRNIQVEIDLIDPGEQAIGYEIQVTKISSNS